MMCTSGPVKNKKNQQNHWTKWKKELCLLVKRIVGREELFLNPPRYLKLLKIKILKVTSCLFLTVR